MCSFITIRGINEEIPISSIQSIQDLCNIINVVYIQYLHGIQSSLFDVREINSLAQDSNKEYTRFFIRKKSGGKRLISSPKGRLKVLQKCISLILNRIYKTKGVGHVFGFVPSKGIKDHAKLHLGRKYLLCLDIKDFFTNIHQNRIINSLIEFGLSSKVSRIISSIATYEDINGNSSLPQGAPTSPIISNFVCASMDLELNRLRNNRGSYSRYADDIVFSRNANVFSKTSDFRQKVEKVISKYGFKINHSKTRILGPGSRHLVTGIVNNKKLNLPRRFRKKIRTILHNWETDGYEQASYKFILHYLAGPKTQNRKFCRMENVLLGYLSFMKFLNPESSSKMISKYYWLLNRDKNIIDQFESSTEILLLNLKQKKML